MDINQLLSALSEIIFIGQVSSLNASEGTATVTRSDRDYKVSAPLHVINRGSQSTKDYWMPAIDDQVLCIMLPNKNGNGYNEGFIIGSFFSTEDAPPGGAGAAARVLDTPGDMTLNVGGNLMINASGGDVIVNGISLVNHVHGGVVPGGANTSVPE